jgi:hypothetical protein
MQLMALRHSEMAGELATLRVMVPFVADSALGRSPGEIFHVEVVDELVAEFQRLDERCSQLERPPWGFATCSYDHHYRTPVLEEANWSFHMCAQDVQNTRMANSKVNSLQYYDYNISEYISYKMTPESE